VGGEDVLETNVGLGLGVNERSVEAVHMCEFRGRDVSGGRAINDLAFDILG
jgi:hypothetical protein